MIDDCPMTEDCPGYDRDLGVCLLRPEDCEFAPAAGGADMVFEAPDAPTPDAQTPAAPTTRAALEAGPR